MAVLDLHRMVVGAVRLAVPYAAETPDSLLLEKDKDRIENTIRCGMPELRQPVEYQITQNNRMVFMITIRFFKNPT